jgi:hypothetical protein
MAKGEKQPKTEGEKHAGGRPPKFADGPYSEPAISRLIYFHEDFVSEKKLQAHVVAHIERFIGRKADTIIEEQSFPPNQSRKRAKFRMDVVATAGNDHYIIECKAPSANAVVSLVSGVAQLQLYSLVYQKVTGVKPQLILACSKINSFLSTYMAEHAKDITLFVVGKNYEARMQHVSR